MRPRHGRRALQLAAGAETGSGSRRSSSAAGAGVERPKPQQQAARAGLQEEKTATAAAEAAASTRRRICSLMTGMGFFAWVERQKPVNFEFSDLHTLRQQGDSFRSISAHVAELADACASERMGKSFRRFESLLVSTTYIAMW